MKIAISADTGIDLNKETLTRYDIRTIPFEVLLGNDNRYDGEVTSKEITDFVAKTKTLPKTGAINVYRFEEHFKNLLSDYDAVIHFSMSGEVSSACKNAIEAAKKFNNVYVVDTRSLSTGIALLAIYARELVCRNFLPAQIIEKCKSRIDKLQVSTIIARLDYLYKGGRCSALQLFGANILKLRIQIVVKNGKLSPAKKYRGSMDSCVEKYINDTLETYNSPDLSRAFITATSIDSSIVEKAKNTLLKRGFKEVIVTEAGATVTSHAGENALGVLYLNDGEPENVPVKKPHGLIERIKRGYKPVIGTLLSVEWLKINSTAGFYIVDKLSFTNA